MKTETQHCSSCKHWNNKQAELEYSKHYGICTCFKWKFTTTNEGVITNTLKYTQR